jgi:hypothetical protein
LQIVYQQVVNIPISDNETVLGSTWIVVKKTFQLQGEPTDKNTKLSKVAKKHVTHIM